MAATVFLLGQSSFRIAAEILRFPVDAEEQHHLPPLRVANKYFSLSVQLSWSKEPLLDASALHSAAASGRPFGGVLVVSGDQCSSRLGPLQAEWYAIPQSAAFRVALLCVPPQKLSDDLYAEWIRRSLDAGFELVFHEGDVTNCESFEHVPVGAERFGLLQEELTGSARLLQLIHNTAWVLPSPASLPTTATADVAASTKRTDDAPTLLMVGSHEADAIALLRRVGAVLPAATGGSELPAPAMVAPTGQHTLHLSHKYGDLHGVPVAFLPQSLFRGAFIDLAHTLIPRTCQVVVFVDADAGPQSGQRAMSAETVDLCQRAFRGHPQQPEAFVWVATRRRLHGASLHEAEVESIESRGVELIVRDSLFRDGSSESDSSTVGIHGLRRLHEIVACAYQPYAHLRGPPYSSSTSAHPGNRLLWVDLRPDPHTGLPSLLHNVIRHGRGTLVWDDQQRPYTSLRVCNKYMEATLRCHYSGATAPVNDLAAFAEAFHVVVLIADLSTSDLVLQQWAEALVAKVSSDDEDREADCLSGDEKTDNSRLIWFCEALDEQQLQRIDEMDLRVEVTFGGSIDPAVPHPTRGPDDHMVEGAERVAEVITSHRWPQHLLRYQSNPADAPVDSRPPTAESSATLRGGVADGGVGGEVALTKPSADDFRAMDNDRETAATCEPPPHMFVDPDTFRTVCIPELLPGATGSKHGIVSQSGDEDVLLQWMHKLKTKGHLLRRSDRERQAMILAQKLGESIGGEDT